MSGEKPFTAIEYSNSLPHYQLAFEEALFRTAEAGPFRPMLRLWEPSSTYIVMGTGQKAAEDVCIELCRKDGVGIFRRFSGGGTVVHSKGQLCFSMYLPFALSPALNTVEGSYRYVFDIVASVLQMAGVDASFHPPCDFSVRNRKLSGNAQRRGRMGILHHGTLLVDCELAPLARYLSEPHSRPKYRGERKHLEFMTTLKNEGIGTSVVELRENFYDEHCGTAFLPRKEVLDLTESLAERKYNTVEWTFKR